MNKHAHRTLISARTMLLIEHPFFGCLMSHLKPVEALSIPTMATDGRHLFYNPQFVLKQTEEHLVGISAHEAYHCAYRHHIRMGDRDLERWNKACDYVINLDLLKSGFRLPSWVLLDQQYVGMSAEEVYGVLDHEDKQKKKQQQQQGGNGAGDPQQGQQSGNQQPDKSGQGKDQGQGKGQGQKGDQKGQGGGAPQSGQGQGEGGQDDGNGEGQPDINAPDPGGMGGIIPAAPDWDSNGKSAEDARWERITRQAVAVAKSQNAGTVPGFLERLVKDLNKPRIEWQSALRRFTDNSISKEYSWMTPNRRYIHSGLILPGMVADKVHHIIGVMDTSGSINDKMVGLYASEKRALLDEGICDKLTVIYSDVKVKNIQEFERGDELKLDPKGGGGTNFRDVFNRIANDYSDATLVLFFTDLETLDWGDDPGIPVLWVAYGDSRKYERLSKKIPFGETIYIPPS